MSEPHIAEKWQRLLKRILDVIISASSLVLLSPLLLAVAAAVKLTSPGPVLHQMIWVGKSGKRFRGYKFRTMTVGADELKAELIEQNEMAGPVFKLKNDPRVNPVGKILRKFSLDELPQLWSVLKGDMSLVGPRPPMPSEVAGFEAWHLRKLSVTPGMICLWHVNGKPWDFDQWVKMDLEYIDNWSLWLDFKILLKTIPYMLLGKSC